MNNREGRRERSSSPRDRNNAMQAFVMALLVVVGVGFVFLLIMRPTNLYRLKWSPAITAKAKSDTFPQGANMLMFTFPILFVAVLGCVYLHLRKKSSSSDDYYHSRGNNQKNSSLSAWKRPIIIKGLGIVCGIELAFFLMFVAIVAWYYSVSVRISFSEITPESAALNGDKVWEAKLESAGLRLGIAGEMCVMFLMLPVARGSSVMQLLGLTSEASIKYHIWLGHMAMTLLTGHGVCYFIYWAVTRQLSEALEWAKTSASNVAGEISLLAGLIMWATTIPRIRRKAFEVFYYTHHLYIIFMLFYLLHAGIGHFSYSLPGFFIYMVDRYLRLLQSRKNVRLASAQILSCQAVQLNFSKTLGLTYSPTSIIFVNVPSISKMQWHPFTITSNSNLEPEKLSVLIKGEGSWTRKLHEMLSSPTSIENLSVSVEGPYGPTSSDFMRHDSLVMVSGGSGITPFISVIRELIYASETLKCRTPSVILIAAFKNSSDLTMLDLILPIAYSSSQLSNLDLKIEAYVTREKQPSSEAKKNITTVWFKPKSSDAPIAPILGQNNWLWLGAIISASFIMFLILMAIVNRYYIYPRNRGQVQVQGHGHGMGSTSNVFPNPSRAMLNAFFLCTSIVAVSSVAFLWNKNQNAMDSKQIQNVEGATPTSSPNLKSYNEDRELESLPQQALALSTNLHFGERPDLKRILFERKESSVGVLVCGPKKMRHEVAGICSSGLGANLHFESISFSW